MIKCLACGKKFDSKLKKWVEIIHGSEMAVCPDCFSSSDKIKAFKAKTLKVIPKAAKDKAKAKQKAFEKLTDSVKKATKTFKKLKKVLPKKKIK